VPDKPAAFDNNKTSQKELVTGFNEGFNLELENDTKKFKTIKEYEAAQKKLPESKRDSWLDAVVKKKGIELNEKYEGDNLKIAKALLEEFEHNFSRMLYISLPLFAFFLWVLYRRNKNHYFVDHLIFSIHLYCAYFIILFAVQLVNLFTHFVFGKVFAIFSFFSLIVQFFYLYKSLRNHFNQSRKKTLLKFFILNILTVFLMAVLMIVFFMFSLFNI
jgi:hypothetical protein